MTSSKVVFKYYNSNDTLLLPPNLGDYLPITHPCRLVSKIIDSLDISSIESSYKGGGSSSYNPRMLLKVIVYAYLDNVYSGRRMEKLLVENIAYMWLSGLQTPDFRTLNLFRSKRLSGCFEDLFTQIVMLLHEEGLVSLKVQYIDGTKIESVANKYTFVWRGSIEKNKSNLESKVHAVLKAAEEVLEQENSGSAVELTVEELSLRTDNILSKMSKAGIIDKQLRKETERIKNNSIAKLKEYESKLNTLGERNSYSKTDTDATFMRLKDDALHNGQTKPAYNVQISTENQFITNYGIYNRPSDQGTLIPHLEAFKARYGLQSEEVCADSGYGSERNYEYMFNNGITPYVKYNTFHSESRKSFKENIFFVENLQYNAEDDYYLCPSGQHMEYIGARQIKSIFGHISTLSSYRALNCKNCPMRKNCYSGDSDRRIIEVNHKSLAYRAEAKRLLKSDKGWYHRRKRQAEPEAVFGDIKFNHGFKRFRLKSNKKVNVEFGLVALAHNIRKLVRIQNIKTTT